MKVLLNECLPRKLKHALSNHDVTTVPEAGWAGKKNGELLRLMAGAFDVFVTIDGNLHAQQNLSAHPVAFVLLRAAENTLATLKPLMADVEQALASIQPGHVVVVGSGPRAE